MSTYFTIIIPTSFLGVLYVGYSLILCVKQTRLQYTALIAGMSKMFANAPGRPGLSAHPCAFLFPHLSLISKPQQLRIPIFIQVINTNSA